MGPPDQAPDHLRALTRLQELIAIGRRYEAFARENPVQADTQIAELNAPGLAEEAWDLRWVPGVVRAKIARVSSVVVLEFCRMPGDPDHDPALMDVLMPAAIGASCVVAQAYGVPIEIPPHPLPGSLGVLARLLHQLTVEAEDVETTSRVYGVGFPGDFPIVAVIPARVRSRLVALAHLMAGPDESVGPKVVTVVFIIGAVAAESFEPLGP